VSLKDFHTSFHIYEDEHKELMLSDALEIHFLDIVKFRQQKKDIDLNDQLHRWLIYFDEDSPMKLVNDVLDLDPAIKRAQAKMDMIRRDPALQHAYDMLEITQIDYLFGMQGAKQVGKREGERIKSLEIARNMRDAKIPIKEISNFTGLSAGDIENIL
jgi:predicted transposase/invertase (TIGR01784 family)